MGIFSSIGRVLGGAVGGLVTGGPLGAIGGAVGAIARRPAASPMPILSSPFAGASTGGVVPVPGWGGAISRALPGGQSGYTSNKCMTKDGRMRRIRRDGQCWKAPSMNPMNHRAASRAITRIKSARRILQRIERSLPKRKASGCGCKGRARR